MEPKITVRQRRALRTEASDQLTQARAQLESLTRSLDDIVEATVMSNVDDEHDPEGTTIAFERANIIALRRQAQADCDGLADMLERVESDDFGACAICTDFIGVERLLALPATTRCIRCAG
jgi:DnaK suppressor protein